MREQRIQQMKEEYQEKQTNRTLGHGTYQEIVEAEFLPLVTKTKYVVVAFFHQDFQRCKIIDMHLQSICRKHEEARFVRMDAERCPFFVNKLGIQMLPTIIMFVNGVAVDRIVGFDDLGGKDDFPELALTRLLIGGGVLYPLNRKERGEAKITRLGRQQADSSSDDDD